MNKYYLLISKKVRKILLTTLKITSLEKIIDMEYTDSSHNSREEINRYFIEQNRKCYALL